MTDLHERLREAGRALDERAPAFDARSLMTRVAGDDEPAAVVLAADTAVVSRRRRLVRVAIAAAAVVLVAAVGLAVVQVERETVTTGPASLPGDPEGGDGADGANAGSSAPTSTAADVPDTIEMTCDAEATVLSGSTVGAQADGVHLRVRNPHPMAEVVLEISGATAVEGYRRGVPFGVTDLILPIPPGPIGVVCHESGVTVATATVEVVDGQERWRDPTLGCPSPSGNIGYGEPTRGPFRATPEEAVRAWSGVLDDTVVRQVGYPDEPTRRYLAALSGGDVLFAVSRSDDGTWSAVAQAWCTGVRPTVRDADDPAQAWYDREGIGQVRADLGRRVEVHEDDGAIASADRLARARLWCAELKLQTRLLGGDPPEDAPAPDLEALRQRAVDELRAAGAACPDDDATLAVDGAFAASDEHLDAAKQALDDLRRLVAGGG